MLGCSFDTECNNKQEINVRRLVFKLKMDLFFSWLQLITLTLLNKKTVLDANNSKLLKSKLSLKYQGFGNAK